MINASFYLPLNECPFPVYKLLLENKYSLLSITWREEPSSVVSSSPEPLPSEAEDSMDDLWKTVSEHDEERIVFDVPVFRFSHLSYLPTFELRD
jgi:hypothetical protein